MYFGGMTMKKSIICILLSLIMVITVATNCIAKDNDYQYSEKISINVAATIAMLFVKGQIKNDVLWNQTTTISNIEEINDFFGEVSAYCILLKTGSLETGYVVVSRNLHTQLILEYSYDGVFCNQEYFWNIVEDDSLYQNNELFIDNILNTGVLYLGSGNDTINNPLTYLEDLYYGETISYSSGYSIGNYSIYNYSINHTNACSIYGVAAIIKYYLPSFSYNDIVDNCIDIAVSNNSIDPSQGYYVPLGSLQPLATLCCEYYDLDKTVESLASFSWAIAKGEINNNRPILYNVWFNQHYHNHTVTAFGWSTYSVYLPPDNLFNMNFFAIRSGYGDGVKYICVNTTLGDFLTRFY